MMKILLLLFAGHALCDFPLQGEFLATRKNPFLADPNLRAYGWKKAMSAHCLIHAGMVTLITGSVFLGGLEFLVHFATDYGKCRDWIDSDLDQAIHYVSKILWAILAVSL